MNKISTRDIKAIDWSDFNAYFFSKLSEGWSESYGNKWILLRKPWTAHEADKDYEFVLGLWRNPQSQKREYAVWFHRFSTDNYSRGQYFDNLEDALDNFNQAGEIKTAYTSPSPDTAEQILKTPVREDLKGV